MATDQDKSSEGSNFVVQGSILAIASIVVRIIGIAYRIPMINIIGDEGMGYYGTAFNVYNIALLLSSYSLPLAVSKMVAARIAKGQYRNAKRILKASLAYATVVGGIMAAIIWFAAPFIASELFYMPYASFALRTLAPTIWIMAYLGVLRGYFQGQNTMVPTAVSQIFEQIVNAIVSVVAGSILFNEALKVEILRGETGTGYSNAWGAAGGTTGTGAGALTALIFLIILYFVGRNAVRRRERRDRNSRIESYSEITRVLFLTVVPVIISSSIYNLNSVIDNGILAHNFASLGQSADFAAQWGVYTGKYHLLINVPMAVSNALASSLIPSVTNALAKGDRKLVRSRSSTAVTFSLIIAIPSAVGLTVLAGPINNLLFSGDNTLAIQMMLTGGLAVVFYSVSTVTNAILQGIDRMNIPIYHSVISLVLHIIALEIMFYVFDLGIFSMVFANILFAFFMCVMNFHSLSKEIGYRQEIRRSIALPTVSAAVMGIFAFLIYEGLYRLIGINAVCTIAAIFFAVLIYGVLLIKFGCLTKEELVTVPGGTRLYQLFTKLHLMK